MQGPKGKLRQVFPPGINFELADGKLRREASSRRSASSASSTAWRAAWWPTPSTGVTDGFKRELDIVGVGYRAEVKGKQVDVRARLLARRSCSTSRPGIEIAIEKQTHITVTGVDRQLVGQVAANIRRLRKPDPVQAEGRPLHR